MILIFTIIYIIFLAAVIYFDHKSFIIPNGLTFPAIALFLFFCIITKIGIWDILLRMAATGGVFIVAGLLTSLVLKKETIGGGDIKLITAIGLFKGWQDGLFIIFLSAVSALVCVLVLVVLKKRKMEDPIPFGFYIALCAVIFEGTRLL